MRGCMECKGVMIRTFVSIFCSNGDIRSTRYEVDRLWYPEFLFGQGKVERQIFRLVIILQYYGVSLYPSCPPYVKKTYRRADRNLPIKPLYKSRSSDAKSSRYDCLPSHFATTGQLGSKDPAC